MTTATRLFAAPLCLVGLAFARPVFAQSAPPAAKEAPSLSPYERETLSQALVATRSEVDPNPEGKIVEAVLIRPLDVLEQRDPLPGFLISFLNFFHAKTRPFVIERQVLMKAGDRYEAALADESARNLRRIRQLSLVLVAALKGSKPDRVKLLVITKDIWSLRLNSDFRLANDQLEYLLIEPSEENLAGLHHSASLKFELQPDTYSFGLGYKVPRVGASWIQAAVTTNVLVNRETGAVEGTNGTFSYGQPLFSTKTEWAFIASLSWKREVTRFFNGVEPLTFDAASTEEDDAIPIQYDTDSIGGRVSFVRSFGTKVKHDVMFGAEAARVAYREPDLSAYAPAVRDEFREAELPVGDKRIYPYVGYATYSTNFKSYVDLETLGLQEDYRKGHDFFVKSYPVIAELGSERSFFGTAAGASTSVALGEGHMRAYSQGVIEAAPERVYDASWLVGGRVVSPRVGVGRLIADGYVFQRFANYLNRRSTIGGDTRLRGYPSTAYRGENVFAFNLELRSRPVELWTLQLGAAAFFDVGAAWDHGESVDPKPSIGTGLRLLFPQLERTVMRFDWALPLEMDPAVGVTSVFPGRFIVTFDQAFPFPAVATPFVAP